MDQFSKYLINVVFVLISQGWTITFMDLEEFELMIPLLTFMGII